MKYQIEYLSILRVFNEHGYPLDKSIDSMTDRQYFAIRELIDDNYLKGEVSDLTKEGTIKHDIFRVTVTLKGRLFQDSLEEHIAKRTLRGRLKTLIPIFIAIMVGAVSASVGKIVDHLLKEGTSETRTVNTTQDREAPKDSVDRK